MREKKEKDKKDQKAGDKARKAMIDRSIPPCDHWWQTDRQTDRQCPRHPMPLPLLSLLVVDCGGTVMSVIRVFLTWCARLVGEAWPVVGSAGTPETPQNRFPTRSQPISSE